MIIILADVIVTKMLGVICLDRGEILALAIGAISPRYAPGSQYSFKSWPTWKIYLPEINLINIFSYLVINFIKTFFKVNV